MLLYVLFAYVEIPLKVTSPIYILNMVLASRKFFQVQLQLKSPSLLIFKFKLIFSTDALNGTSCLWTKMALKRRHTVPGGKADLSWNHGRKTTNLFWSH